MEAAKIKETVRENLIKLRKEHKYTQLELSEKISYSDKAISRWETGEVTPDVETLARLAELYGVDIAVFFSEYDSESYKNKLKKDTFLGQKIAVLATMLMALWYIGIMLFIYSNSVSFFSRSWMVFIWLIPITVLFCIPFNMRWGNRIIGMLLNSLLCWSLLTAIYLQTIEYNMYLLFISGAPIQVSIIILAYLRKNNKI